eukprot:CAMPEP_0202865544 /NCGR_PEP_ID=MMETSP1391-20130828/6225_1 /ASSEMBLY_ACC=CAM_ASM_000867 /TAXON_ID=1034604 /ORGANISM="Chlamydomonas leiostraca, Strain SAG 11-49" /LENGTH=266 /DNA_ID=CAMNT_0049545403 /DNA_START=197 /DNA_END=999 /DNA_ORIENTATION=+
MTQTSRHPACPDHTTSTKESGKRYECSQSRAGMHGVSCQRTDACACVRPMANTPATPRRPCSKTAPVQYHKTKARRIVCPLSCLKLQWMTRHPGMQPGERKEWKSAEKKGREGTAAWFEPTTSSQAVMDCTEQNERQHRHGIFSPLHKVFAVLRTQPQSPSNTTSPAQVMHTLQTNKQAADHAMQTTTHSPILGTHVASNQRHAQNKRAADVNVLSRLCECAGTSASCLVSSCTAHRHGGAVADWGTASTVVPPPHSTAAKSLKVH